MPVNSRAFSKMCRVCEEYKHRALFDRTPPSKPGQLPICRRCHSNPLTRYANLTDATEPEKATR